MPQTAQHDTSARILIARNSAALLRLHYALPLAQRLRGALSDTSADRARFVAAFIRTPFNDDQASDMAEPSAMALFDAFSAMARSVASGQGRHAANDCLSWICRNLLAEPVVPRVEDLLRMGADAARLRRR